MEFGEMLSLQTATDNSTVPATSDTGMLDNNQGRPVVHDGGGIVREERSRPRRCHSLQYLHPWPHFSVHLRVDQRVQVSQEEQAEREEVALVLRGSVHLQHRRVSSLFVTGPLASPSSTSSASSPPPTSRSSIC